MAAFVSHRSQSSREDLQDRPIQEDCGNSIRAAVWDKEGCGFGDAEDGTGNYL